MSRYGRPLADRFWSRVDRSGDCWTWTGALVNGYGRIKVEGRSVLAPRIAWELTNGPIPTGLEVRHHCDNPPCVRPEHLALGTHAENMDDSRRRGRAANRHTYVPVTHCPQGHVYDAANTYVHQNERHCRICTRAADRRRRAREKAA